MAKRIVSEKTKKCTLYSTIIYSLFYTLLVRWDSNQTRPGGVLPKKPAFHSNGNNHIFVQPGNITRSAVAPASTRPMMQLLEIYTNRNSGIYRLLLNIGLCILCPIKSEMVFIGIDSQL